MKANNFLNVVIVFLVVVCLGVGAYVVMKGKADSDRVQVEEPTISATPVPTPAPTMIPEIAEYYNKNADTIGYLKIDGTPIDYPVLFTPDDIRWG